ncbi:DUF6461 domain-containing protein [Sphaerisporangium sp. NBC_01403]|uniref:DUF6461 domain-containing protein n=1 Tax=Sphaerisporangium sp. NBC_01403 TaxID=2903599 RepID=UPI00324A06A6
MGLWRATECARSIPEHREIRTNSQRPWSGSAPPTPHEGPSFLLAERLTGITITPQLLEGSTYLCGGVPKPR